MTPICPADQLPENDARGFTVNGRSLIAVKQDGQIYLYENNCPHRGIPLEWQPDQFLDAERNFIQCATHGALFKIDSGECIAGPCPGERLTKVACELVDGQLMLAE